MIQENCYFSLKVISSPQPKRIRTEMREQIGNPSNEHSVHLSYMPLIAV